MDLDLDDGWKALSVQAVWKCRIEKIAQHKHDQHDPQRLPNWQRVAGRVSGSCPLVEAIACCWLFRCQLRPACGLFFKGLHCGSSASAKANIFKECVKAAMCLARASVIKVDRRR